MPRSPCTANGMADHWIAQALWDCMTNTQGVGDYQQGHPKPTATSGTEILGAVNRHSRVSHPPRIIAHFFAVGIGGQVIAVLAGVRCRQLPA